MRLNVINLPARADRRAQFEAWNARPGIEIAFVDAVIGATIDRSTLIAQKLLAEENSGFSAGALGNALSNRALWLQAAAVQAPIFVCEDDACLSGGFVTQAQDMLAQIAPDWDIVFFGYNTNALVATASEDGLKTLLYFDESAKRRPGYFEAFASARPLPSTPLRCVQAWGTLCYAISPNGARRLLEACFPLSAAVEIDMFGQSRTLKPYTLDGMINLALQRAPVKAYCAFPPLAVSSNDVAGSDVVKA